MCGIAGILNIDGSPVTQKSLRKMTDAIAHRGPDGEGFYTDDFIGLGHRRLAIIDLSDAGRQPMITKDGQYALTYNGEIYNFRELRTELEKLGHKFKSKTDSEVVLHSYVQWQEKCLDRFNGMFAFAIWDRSRQQLFLARDRYGIKPLYYCVQGNKFMFASESKAFLTQSGFKREMDLEALYEYFTFQNIFTSRTLLKGVRILPAGSYIKVRLDGPDSVSKPVQYWDFDFSEPGHPLKEKEYIDEFDRLFKQAVNRQLVSDVEIGAYLSGGMDSGAITAIAVAQFPYIKTFTCGFDLSSASGLEMGFDERQKAEYMSNLFKTEHYEMVLKAGDMERVFPKLARCIEEPRVGQSYPNFYIAQLASKFVKVVLSGVGGDELFGGYPWRYYRAASNNDFEDYIDKYYLFWQRLVPNRFLKKMFSPIADKVSGVWTRDIFKDVFSKKNILLKQPEDYINYSLYFEAKTFLHGLLVVEDKLSMANSLEVRVPFLDNDLVDFAMKIPVRMKLGDLNKVIKLNENETGPKKEKYFRKTRDGKLILRKAMKKYIPAKITGAIKQGFSAPDASWFRGQSIDYVKKTIFNKNSLIYDFFDQNTVKKIVMEHIEGKNNHRLFIWSLLNFEHICKSSL
jgi:asparagine synthase (glutamine-hydrolysing)